MESNYLYRCTACDYNVVNQSYNLTWTCKNDRCFARAKTVKFYTNDRGNYDIRVKDLVFRDNPFPNYNFKLYAPHEQCEGFTAVSLKTIQLVDDRKRHFAELGPEIPTLQAIRTYNANLSVDIDPLTRAASEFLQKETKSERNLRRIQQKNKPRVHQEDFDQYDPTTINSQTFPEEKLMSIHNDPTERKLLILLYHATRTYVTGEDGQGNQIKKTHVLMIWGHPFLMVALFQAQRMYLDGTFQTCPKQFKQVIMLHIIKNGFTITAGYMLLTGKHKYLVKWALEVLFELARTFQEQGLYTVPNAPTISWKRVTTDFEPSLLLAFDWFRSEHNLTFETSCCYFHFCQLILRHARTTGFASFFNENKLVGENMRHFMRYVMAIPFLPVERIGPVYAMLYSQIIAVINTAYPVDVPANAPLKNAIMVTVDKFTTYLSKYWIDSNSAHCVPHKYYCVHDLEEYRTNNNAEGIHNKARLPEHFGTKPKLFKWIEVVKLWLVEDCRSYTILCGAQSQEFNYKEKKYLDRDAKRTGFKTELTEGRMTDIEFVHKIAHFVIDSKEAPFNEHEQNEVDYLEEH